MQPSFLFMYEFSDNWLIITVFLEILHLLVFRRLLNCHKPRFSISDYSLFREEGVISIFIVSLTYVLKFTFVLEHLEHLRGSLVNFMFG